MEFLPTLAPQMDGVAMDYAEPLIRAEQKVKQIYQACIEKRPCDAMELCLEAIVELRAAYSAIHDDVERKDPNPVGIWNLKDLA